MDWAGNITNSDFELAFSGTGGTGTAYVFEDDDGRLVGKTVFYSKLHNKYYKPKEINANGTAKVSTSQITTLSEEADSSFINTTETDYAVELVEITKTDAGIPDTITPPLTMEFK